MTKLLVLGLLDGGPMSGYDLQQKLGGRTRSGGAACFRAPSTTRSKSWRGRAASPWRGWSRRAIVAQVLHMFSRFFLLLSTLIVLNMWLSFHPSSWHIS